MNQKLKYEKRLILEDELARYDHGAGSKQDPQQHPSEISAEHQQQS